MREGGFPDNGGNDSSSRVPSERKGSASDISPLILLLLLILIPVHQSGNAASGFEIKVWIRNERNGSKIRSKTGRSKPLLPPRVARLNRSPFEMAFCLEYLHDLQGGEGVVGGVEQLRGAEFEIRPVTGGDGS